MIKRLDIMVLILFLPLFSMGDASAITGTMGNARMVLYPEVNGWTNTEIEKSLLIKNVNNESINITLQIDAETGEFIELIDKSFILEPETERKAQFTVKVKEEGTYKGKINVLFSSLGEQKTGVGLSSEVIVVAKKDQGSRTGDGDAGGAGTGEEDTGVIGDISGKNKISLTGSGLLIVSVLVLSIILVALMIFISKKGKKGDRRRKKVNARRRR